MEKKITFVLPLGVLHPIGGYKVVYEYANKFIDDGYKVSIIFPAITLWKEKTLKQKIKGIIRWISFKIVPALYSPNKWFHLNEKCLLFFVPTLEEKYIPDGNFVFATAVETAGYVNNYSIKKGKKIYLIQSFEEWTLEKERVIATWKFPLKKIVISKYLKKIANELSEEAEYIENGLDFNSFYKNNEITKKNNQIMMLYHTNEKVKQSNKAIDKLKLLKERKKNLNLICFGINSRPSNLPSWIEYYKQPSKKKLNELYNSSSVFISPSKIEGWALPPAEAMQCGTCVCVTEIGGHEYVEHMKTGFKIDVSLDELDKEVEFLLENSELRANLAEGGYEYIKKFTWESAYSKLKKYIENY